MAEFLLQKDADLMRGRGVSLRAKIAEGAAGLKAIFRILENAYLHILIRTGVIF